MSFRINLCLMVVTVIIFTIFMFAAPQGHSGVVQLLKEAVSSDEVRVVTQAHPPKFVVKQIAIDRKEPAYTVYVGIPEGDLPEEMEKEIEEFKRLAKEEGMDMVGLNQLKEETNNYIKARIVKNDYPDSGVANRIVKLIEKFPGVPFGLTWNGGIAFTYNDYQYAKRRYQQYLANPAEYEPERDPRADPVNPKGHLPLLGIE
jgi:hypothetical protein